MSEQVDIEQVREALSQPYYHPYTVMGNWLRQMSDEIERLRSEVAELKRQSDNANNYIQSLKR